MKKLTFLLALLISSNLSAQSFNFKYSVLGEWDKMGKPSYLEAQNDTFDGKFMARFKNIMRAATSIFTHHPELYDDSAMNHVELKEDADVYVTFLNETAGYQNVLGYYSYNPNDTAYTTNDKSLRLNGEDQYGEVPFYDAMNNTNITVEAWVLPLNDDRFSIIRRYGVFQLYVAYSRLYFWINSTTISTSIKLEKNVWNHVVATVEDKGSYSLVKLYINGQLARENGVGGTLPSKNNDITVSWSGSYWYLNGNLDEIVMYNKVLSEEQILERYNKGKSTINLPSNINLNSDVICWFDFNNGDNATAINKAPLGKGYDMTLYNNPTREKGVYKHIPRSFRELADGKITIIFPNVSFIGRDRCLVRGNKVKIGHFSAGTVIHWFLYANGFSGGKIKTEFSGKKCFSSDDAINIESPEYDRHVVMYKDNPTGKFIFGIEDIIQPWGDRDFEDAAFTVSTNPSNAIDEQHIIGYGEPPANPKADLSLTNTVDNNTPKDGDIVTFTLTVKNSGPQTAHNISIYDELPDGMKFIQYSATTGEYDTKTKLWTISELANGSSAKLELSAQINLEDISESAVDLGKAAKFNVFVIDTMQQYSADAEGRLAIGKEGIFDNFTVGYELRNSPDTNGVLIAGYNLTYIGGVIYGGNVLYEHETNLPDSNVEIVNGEVKQDTVIDFTDAESYLLNLSNTLSSYSVNGTTEMTYTQLSCTGTNPFLNVFSVKGEDISAATEFVISVPNGAVALINISGDNIDWGGGLVVSGTDISNVLYNFYEAKNIRIRGIDVTGSILAPKAHINFVSGVQNGQMITRALEGAAQYNNVLFKGLIPSDSILVNIAEIVKVDEEDPDSKPGNGVEKEDDYASVSISFAAKDTINNTGVEWKLVGNSGNGDLIWTMVRDKDGKMLTGNWGGKIYRSADEGGTWSLINPQMSVKYIWSLGVDGDYIYAGTEQGLYVSSDNGKNWKLAFGNNIEIRSIFVKDNKVYAATWGGGVYYSEDNGTTWKNINDNLVGIPFTSIVVTDKGTIILGSFDSGIYRSTDGGKNFENVNIDYRFIWTLAVNSKGYLFAGTYGNGIYSSIDDGNSWEKDFGVTARYIYSFKIDADNNLFASSWSSGVFVAKNGGTLRKGTASVWHKLGLAGMGVTSVIQGETPNILFAATEDGKLYKTENALLGVSNPTSTPYKFELLQNYPNPFNPTTTIKYTIPTKIENGQTKGKGIHVTLSVYNALGQRIAILVNKELTGGSYTVKFDGRNLPSGIYFYRMNAGNFSTVRKMLLLK